MVSQRYVDFKIMYRKFFHEMGRYMLLVYFAGLILFYIIEILRPHVVIFAYVWIFVSFSIIMFIYLVLMRASHTKPKDLDGDV